MHSHREIHGWQSQNERPPEEFLEVAVMRVIMTLVACMSAVHVMASVHRVHVVTSVHVVTAVVI
jgi:hypothetical protein